MSVKRDEIIEYLNEYLKVKDFQDYCHNGLQIEGKEDVSKVITGVTMSMALIGEAIKEKAEMIIVHHGIFLRDIPSPLQLGGLYKARIKEILHNDINFAGYHLPLDAHPVIGNNISLCKLFGMKKCRPFDVGFVGELDEAVDLAEFVKIVNDRLQTGSLVLPYGKNRVKKIAVISGGSSVDFKQAFDRGADVFIGGDIREEVVRKIEEIRFNFINAGHYNTEKLGIQNLGKLIEKRFKIKAEFIDIPCDV
ncbi:MAG: Nif3-like dinuclear metal center hexameric protein [Candidatus Paceibacterota bacterium]|jgi:dinuclear metal center YbgI/SA1388 family protein